MIAGSETPLYFEMYGHDTDIGTSCLSNLSEAFLEKKCLNSWIMERRMSIVESDLRKVTPAALL